MVRASILLLLLTAGCAAEDRAPGRRRARSDAVEGCDAARLREVVRQLDGRVRGRGHFHDRVPVGPVTERAARCERGEPLSACRARHERPHHHVWLRARTERRVRMVAAQPRGPLERELAELAEGDELLEVGRTVQERHVVDERVCAWTAPTERVRVPRVTASGADPLDVLRFAREAGDLVVEIEEDGFRVRCAAVREVVERPDVRGACAGI